MTLGALKPVLGSSQSTPHFRDTVNITFEQILGGVIPNVLISWL